MFKIKSEKDTKKRYKYMVEAIENLLEGEDDLISALSNISAFINEYMDKINWVGFYILKDETLVVAPFQGAPACSRIQIGQGVCGKAVQERKNIIVEDVNEFKGHIACSLETKSEIVLPIYSGDKVFGVLDIDSPEINRFTSFEEKYLQQIVNSLSVFIADL